MSSFRGRGVPHSHSRQALLLESVLQPVLGALRGCGSGVDLAR